MLAPETSRDLADALAAMHERGVDVRERELATALGRLDDLDDDEREVIETVAERLVAGVLAPPTRSLVAASAEGDERPAATALALFGDEQVSSEEDSRHSSETDDGDERFATETSVGLVRAQD